MTVAASPAAAYPTGAQFDTDAVASDGAGGVAFTGAPRWAGRTCDVCHTNAPGRIGLKLEADPVDIFSTGFVPGKTYRMRVVLVDEWAARSTAAKRDQCGPHTTPYVPCDDNGFAMEIDDGGANPVGKFAPAMSDGSCGGNPSDIPRDADVRVFDDGTAVTQSGAHHGQNSWTLCWTAPGANTGPVTAYLAAVDGGGGDGTVENPNNTEGDDVFAGAVPLLEQGQPPPDAQVGGCNASGGSSSAAAALVLLLLAALSLRRRPGAILACFALAVAMSSAACVTVRPWQREKLAQRKMQFSPDPAETELDLHMEEAREGSTGGYGSAGGGCGCN